MNRKIITFTFGIAVLFSIVTFVSADTQPEAMNKAEFVSAEN